MTLCENEFGIHINHKNHKYMTTKRPSISVKAQSTIQPTFPHGGIEYALSCIYLTGVSLTIPDNTQTNVYFLSLLRTFHVSPETKLTRKPPQQSFRRSNLNLYVYNIS